jgi:hypothetical protein
MNIEGGVSEVRAKRHDDSTKTKGNDNGERTSFTPQAHTKEFRVNQWLRRFLVRQLQIGIGTALRKRYQ